MVFRPSSKNYLQGSAALVTSAALALIGVQGVWGSYSSPTSMMAFGFGLTYLLAIGSASIGVACIVTEYHEYSLIKTFPRTIALILAAAIITTVRLVLFGKYFHEVTYNGFESTHLIDWDRYLIRILHYQLLAFPLLASILARNGRFYDSILSIIFAFILAVMTLG